MTGRQISAGDALSGLLRRGTAVRLGIWMNLPRHGQIYRMRRFARTLRQDIAAARDAVHEPWSNGQAEGQINKLKPALTASHPNDAVAGREPAPRLNPTHAHGNMTTLP
jgi:hypothetical protein